MVLILNWGPFSLTVLMLQWVTYWAFTTCWILFLPVIYRNRFLKHQTWILTVLWNGILGSFRFYNVVMASMILRTPEMEDTASYSSLYIQSRTWADSAVYQWVKKCILWLAENCSHIIWGKCCGVHRAPSSSAVTVSLWMETLLVVGGWQWVFSLAGQLPFQVVFIKPSIFQPRQSLWPTAAQERNLS